jgi:hypothetical protein
MSDSKTGVICIRALDQPVPAVHSRTLVCSRCTHPVWISATLLDALGGPDKVEPLCTWCAPPDATISIHPITAREVAEWLDAQEASRGRSHRS